MIRVVKMKKKLIITKKRGLRGEDDNRIFSVRMKKSTIEKLDRISEKTDRSRNEIINIILEYELNENILSDEFSDSESDS